MPQNNRKKTTTLISLSFWEFVKKNHLHLQYFLCSHGDIQSNLTTREHLEVVLFQYICRKVWAFPCKQSFIELLFFDIRIVFLKGNNVQQIKPVIWTAYSQTTGRVQSLPDGLYPLVETPDSFAPK